MEQETTEITKVVSLFPLSAPVQMTCGSGPFRIVSNCTLKPVCHEQPAENKDPRNS